MLSPSFILRIADATGSFGPKEFTDLKGAEGVADGVVCKVDPFSGVDTIDWTGRPDLLGLAKGEVVQVFIRDATGLHPVGYGALITGHSVEPSDKLEAYQASARALLVGSTCRSDRYRNQDTAVIAFDLVSKYRHAALKVRASDFPASGTVLPEFAARGQLGEVLDKLVEATANPYIGAGVDPTGYIFFKVNDSILEVEYADTDYQNMPMSSGSITTATLWTLELPPSVTPWGGAYLPKPYTYLSIPDAALHEQYGYTRDRDLPLNALQRIPDSDFSASGISNPANAVAASPTVPATRNASVVGTMTLTNDDPLVMGVHVLYKTSEDAGAVTLRANCGVLYEVTLPNTKGELQPLDIPLTPHEGAFSHWSSFRLTAAAAGTVELWGFYPLRVDTARLDAIAPVVVPEQRPAMTAQKGIQPNPAIVRLLNGPRGTRDVPNAGQRWVWTPQGGAETVRDLEVSAFQDEAKLTKVSGYYRR